MDEPTPDNVAAVAAYLKRREKAQAEAESLPYDGVLGTPPAWVPGPFLARFRQCRDRMLDDWQFQPEQAVECLDRFANDLEGWRFPDYYPNGRERDLDAFLDTVGYLAHLRYVVSLGDIDGLKLLAGEDASLGRKRRKQLTNFARSHAEEVSKEREKEWAKWRNEAARLIKSDPHLGLSGKKSELARKVTASLSLTDSPRTIRKRL